MADTDASTATQPAQRPGRLPVEVNGINVIGEDERRSRPKRLFWPWCAASIAVPGISYGSFFLGFGVSFWQATIAGVRGARQRSPGRPQLPAARRLGNSPLRACHARDRDRVPPAGIAALVIAITLG